MSDIHQEITFKASPAKVYRALTDAEEIAAWTGMEADVSPDEGGAYQCFGVYIVGRYIELVPDKRIVQAWRVFNWEEGVYSLVRIELTGDGDHTTLVLDQYGVPEKEVSHVEPGWHKQYWNPIKKFLREV